jgi:hypothetical protein
MDVPPLPPDRWPDAPGRYPDPAVRVLDPRFDRYRLHNAAVERIATGYRWVEGPVWFGDHHCLVWSDIPSNRMLRWDEATAAVTAFRSPSNHANGNTRDRQGRLVSCEHLTRRVTRTEHDGSITVLIDRFGGRPLNAPNDVVVASDGSIWFTDPGYGIMSDYEGRQAPFELPTAVYRLDPDDGRAEPVVQDATSQARHRCRRSEVCSITTLPPGASRTFPRHHLIRQFRAATTAVVGGGSLRARGGGTGEPAERGRLSETSGAATVGRCRLVWSISSLTPPTRPGWPGSGRGRWRGRSPSRHPTKW